MTRTAIVLATKTTIADVDFQQGTLGPLGTRVTITQVRGNAVTFEAIAGP